MDKTKKKIICQHGGKVVCPGCGKEIRDDDDLSKVEYVRTKRKTDIFFHTACMDRVWREDR